MSLICESVGLLSRPSSRSCNPCQARYGWILSKPWYRPGIHRNTSLRRYHYECVMPRSVSNMKFKDQSGIMSLCLALALPLAPVGHLLAWTGTLGDGSELRVDPSTHRAMQIDGGRVRPLWDGVHQLQDGSVVIIHGGTAVPTEDMLRSWEGAVESRDELEGRPCEQLERRVCGQDNSCRATAGCLSARSLLNSEREAQRRAPFGAGARPATDFSSKCEAALKDPEFPPCASASAGPSSCQSLVKRVCGEADRCASSPACAPARQLLAQELEERAASQRPDASTPSGTQCQEALGNDFFRPCE